MKNTSIFVVEDHSLTNLGIRQFFSEKSNFNCCGFASERDEAIEKLTILTFRLKKKIKSKSGAHFCNII